MADQDPQRVTLYPKGGGSPITVNRQQVERLIEHKGYSLTPTRRTATKTAPAATTDTTKTTTEK